ncbi:MAG: hypothetical protein Q9227_001149 [Pyrenula ochraceoflavens]
MSEAGPSSDPSNAQAAQIPLQDFILPSFPAEASSLHSLTLTSDIKLDEYQGLLQSQSNLEIPPLPSSITDLTLELFSLGFPASFLPQLASRLPNLKSLTVFSSLIDGLDSATRKDAETFIQHIAQNGLRQLHLIDTFCRPGFIRITASAFHDHASGDAADSKGSLQLLEVSYTYRGHNDPTFSSRMPDSEIAHLAAIPSLVAASLVLAAPALPPEGQNASLEDPSNLDANGKLIDDKRPEGIIPISGSSSTILETALLNVKQNKRSVEKRMLDTTLYTLTPAQATKILAAHPTIAVLSMCLIVRHGGDVWFTELKNALKESKELEVLEIVAIPSQEVYEKARAASPSTQDTLAGLLFPSPVEVEELGSLCPKLQSFKMDVLRTRSSGAMEWIRQESDGRWVGGLIRAEGNGSSS